MTKDIESLLDDECFDDFWFISVLLLMLSQHKKDTIINIYINGDKAGE